MSCSTPTTPSPSASLSSMPPSSRSVLLALVLAALSSDATTTSAFNTATAPIGARSGNTFNTLTISQHSNVRTPTTALSAGWFGFGDASTSLKEDEEPVAIHIERTSSNSRRIGGELTVERPIEDVWAILTDYDNLSTHVPNLVESRRENVVAGAGAGGGFRSSGEQGGEQGDGSYQCRLFQKGSQKIIGFNFAASVTMDMVEELLPPVVNEFTGPIEERRIAFKCVESQFFTEFDGEWRVRQASAGSTTISYSVDVRPKGPVPVAALEWRIREDVPTNLRAVKKAAVEVGYDGVMKMRRGSMSPSSPVIVGAQQARAAAVLTGRTLLNQATEAVTAAAASASMAAQQQPVPIPVRVVDWLEDETMAAYLNE